MTPRLPSTPRAQAVLAELAVLPTLTAPGGWGRLARLGNIMSGLGCGHELLDVARDLERRATTAVEDESLMSGAPAHLHFVELELDLEAMTADLTAARTAIGAAAVACAPDIARESTAEAAIHWTRLATLQLRALAAARARMEERLRKLAACQGAPS